MKLSEKILSLRKQHGLSQEELAENLNVSRQTVSRWEMGTALPDAANILQISKLFNVSTDYLLNDDYDTIQNNSNIKSQKEFWLLLVMQMFCFVFHIIACFFNTSRFIVIISIIMNTFFAAKLYNEFNNYDLSSNIIQKYYLEFYLIIIWLMTYKILIYTNNFYLMIYYSLFGDINSYFSASFYNITFLILVCILPAIITIYFIKKKRKN